MEKINIGVVIVAGGSGTRIGGSIPKQFCVVGGEPLLVRIINTFSEALPAAEVVVVLPASHIEFWKNLAARFEVAPHRCVAGGSERFHSVKAGIEALSEDTGLIAIQDGARALTSKKVIIRAVQTAIESGSAIPVVTPVDSFRVATGEESHPIDRSTLRIVQTPQIFRAEMLHKAYQTEYQPSFTDDASVVEYSGERVTLCEGERSNIKITNIEDMAIAEALLAQRDGDIQI
ncbi:MAG: 2-C-methyl-D-erythritol 4-phosphate cytidylyltransferase [Rikenellaceae bacterium]|nr:2-C-methyl-D-erythritol 4-phosphate cytidylyltransferase [Rikenellaceae bacterium]